MKRVKHGFAVAGLALLAAGHTFAAPAAPSAKPSAAPAPMSAPSAPASAAAAKPAAAPLNNGHVAQPASGPENGAPPPGHAGMGGMGDGQQADVNESVPGLEPGSITATIVDERGNPLSGQQVRLGVMFQKIAEGEKRSEKFAQADTQGTVRFTDLTRGSDFAYRVTVHVGAANYQTAPFNLRPEMGQRVILHAYPATSEIELAQVGMRGYLYVETRDDVFQCEAMFRVFNVGQNTWVPKNVVVQLPKGFKAFKAQEGMTDVGFEQVDGIGARLKGTFGPGQNEAAFRFQLPKANDDTLTFRMSLPPHVAEMRVIAEASSTMNLDVEGFQPPVATANNNGQRVLVSVKQLLRRDGELKDFVATLSGIPTPGPGRWFAVAIAVCLCGFGVLGANGVFDGAAGGKDLAADKKRARDVLLSELVALEAARRAERIGPRSYAESRSALIDAIARLGLPAEGPRKRSRDGKGNRSRKQPRSAPEQS